MKTFLIVNTLVPAESILFAELCQLLTKTGCNIDESLCALFGSTQSIALFISGSWDVIVKAETALNNFAKRHKIQISHGRTVPKPFNSPNMPYYVQIVALDRQGIISEVTEFFRQEDILIGKLESSIQKSHHTGAEIFNLNMVVYIHEDIAIADLRERFIIFSDSLNLDSIIEPLK